MRGLLLATTALVMLFASAAAAPAADSPVPAAPHSTAKAVEPRSNSAALGTGPVAAATVPHPGAAAASHTQDLPPTTGEAFIEDLALKQKPTPGEIQLEKTNDYSFLDPIAWSVMIYKSAHRLKVYYKGSLFGTYDAVFGRNPDSGAKEWAGDLKTPEGVYEIVQKHRSARWQWFLRLNYPNSVDRSRYDTMLHDGLVPVVHGHLRSIGGEIGIHGTDRPLFNHLNLNWTLGCISVDRRAIDLLDRLLPVGTLVVINP